MRQPFLYILHKISLCFSTFKNGTGSIIRIDFYGFKRYHLSMEPVPTLKGEGKGQSNELYGNSQKGNTIRRGKKQYKIGDALCDETSVSAA